MTRRLPLHDHHAAAGAVFAAFAGWDVPARYADARTEYAAARGAAALADAGFLGRSAFRGPDRREFLQGLLTSDVAALGAGRGASSCLLTIKGKIAADLSLYDRGDDFLAVASPASAAGLAAGLRTYLPLSDTTLDDLEPGTFAFRLIGPAAGEVFARAGVAGAPPGSGECRASEWRGEPLTAASYPAAAPQGILLMGPAARGEDFWAALRAAGAAPVGVETLEVLRVEAGIPLFGVDAGETHYPVEVNLDGAVSGTKGCYLGQETVMRLKTQGRARHRLTGIRSAAPLAPGRTVRAGGRDAGTISSAVFSPRLDAYLGLAVVDAALVPPGAALEVVSPDGPTPAQAVSLPVEG